MARRLTDAISATSALAALIVAVGATGTAVAATGGTFLLGKSNSATSTTTLTNSKGVALSLKAPSGSPALAVSNTKKVARLNADLLDNLDSSKLQRRVGGTCSGVRALQSIGAGGGVACSRSEFALFTNGGTTSDYVVPAGVHKLYIRALAGGSGGGGGSADSAGGGGGSGGMLEVLMDVTPGETLGVHVGEGGAGGALGQPGDNGGGSGINRGIDIVFGAFNANSGFAGGAGACSAGTGGIAPNEPAVIATGVLTIGSVDGSGGGDANCTIPGPGGHHGFAGGGGNGGAIGAAGEAGISGYVLIEAMG